MTVRRDFTVVVEVEVVQLVPLASQQVTQDSLLYHNVISVWQGDLDPRVSYVQLAHIKTQFQVPVEVLHAHHVGKHRPLGLRGQWILTLCMVVTAMSRG